MHQKSLESLTQIFCLIKEVFEDTNLHRSGKKWIRRIGGHWSVSNASKIMWLKQVSKEERLIKISRIYFIWWSVCSVYSLWVYRLIIFIDKLLFVFLFCFYVFFMQMFPHYKSCFSLPKSSPLYFVFGNGTLLLIFILNVRC